MRLIGVFDADGGFVGELSYIIGHLVGTRECALCDITHSPIAKKAQWKALDARLLAERGIRFDLMHKNERNETERLASDGVEPCVLIEHADGSLTVLLDRDELTAAHGDVAAFERLLLEKLDAREGASRQR